MKKIKELLLIEFFFAIVGNYLAIVLFNILINIIQFQSFSISPAYFDVFNSFIQCKESDNFAKYMVFINLFILWAALYMTYIPHSKGHIYATNFQKITDKICIPVKAGSGQFGWSHFMDNNELRNTAEISCFNYIPSKQNKPKEGGFVLGVYEAENFKKKLFGKSLSEKIMVLGGDRHLLLVGATRSGKTRRIILESIWYNLNAGVNIMVPDPKGELYAFTCKYAEKVGYKKVVIDLREPSKSNHINFLQNILEAVKENKITDAIEYTWDLVSVLVGEEKGEPIWYNGECAAIAATILIIVLEAPECCKNMTNVYYFLSNMIKTSEYGVMHITRYLQKLPEMHPARAAFAMADSAPSRTRGSFFTSALGTLRHFTNPKIAEMTSFTDVTYEQMCREKTIVYIILPDEKKTLYSIGSLFIMQHYIHSVNVAQKNGGRCPIDWWYLLDEFGQLPYMNQMPQLLSVAGGRGIHALLVLQDFQQLQKVYKDDNNTMKNNCDCWVYMKASEEDTQKEFSGRLGTYTVQVNSSNFTKEQKQNEGNYSASLTERELLKPSEVAMIESPYMLVCIAGKSPLMAYAPDLKYYHMNKEMGLGNQQFNRKLIIERNAEREERSIDMNQFNLWGIWNDYIELVEEEAAPDLGHVENKDNISFLN